MDAPPPFWQDRPTLVTGATGLVGGWLVRRLVAAGADVVCLVRDWVPQSEFVRGGAIWSEVKVVRGDVRDQALLERTLGEYEIDTVFHLAAQTIVGIANRNPLSTFETNIQGTWSPAGGLPPQPAASSRSSSPPPTRPTATSEQLPYTEDAPLQGRHPYDVSKSCADLIAQTYAATYGLPVAVTRCGNFYGGGDLNWNRIVPGTIRSVLRGAAAGDPLRRQLRPRLLLRRGRRGGLPAPGRVPGRRRRSCAARRSTSPTSCQVTVLELVRRILRLMDSTLEPDVRNEASDEIRHQYLERRQGPATCWAGSRCSTWTRAWRRPSPGTGSSSAMTRRRPTPCGRQILDLVGRNTTRRPSRPATVRARPDAGARGRPGLRRRRSCGSLVDAVARLLADHRPLRRSSSRAASPGYFGLRHALLVNSGSSANLLALSCLTSPQLGDAAAAARRRSDHRGRRLSHHGQPDRPERPGAGLRGRDVPDLQRRRRPAGSGLGRPHQGDHARPHAGQSVRPGRGDGVRPAARPLADRGLLRRRGLDLRAAGTVGTFGDLATVSFYPAHHITMGEGGACSPTSRG